MKAFIVYCHPSEDSLTRSLRDEFIKGILDSGNEYVLSDLYKMDFKTDMTEEEYLRDAYYRDTPKVADDVLSLSILFFGRKHLQNLWDGLTESGLTALLTETKQ